MNERRAIMLVAALVGAIFLAGLFIHGVIGGLLLLVTVAILITLSRATWDRVRPQGRPIRVVVIVLIAAVAVFKLVHG